MLYELHYDHKEHKQKTQRNWQNKKKNLGIAHEEKNEMIS